MNEEIISKRLYNRTSENWGLIKNTSKVYYNDSRWKSRNYGYFKIVGKTNKYRLRKNKYKEYCYYQSEFAIEYNLSNRRISDCIKGRYKSHKGWKFKVVDNNE